MNEENQLEPTPAGDPTPAPPPETEPRPSSRGRWLERGRLLSYALIVLAVLIAVNRLAVLHDKSWDLTRSHRYSLSPESIQIVRQLKQPLHMIYFNRSSHFSSAKAFLTRYARASRQVHLDFVDPDRHPMQARRYKVQTYGTLVLALPGRTHNVSTLSEQKITNALVRMLKGARKIAYFAQGDGERRPAGTGRSGYSSIARSLKSENFTVKPLVLDQTPQVPANASVLVIAGPTHAWLPAEVTAVANYLAQGGRVLFMFNFQSGGPLVHYVEQQLDVKLTPNVIVDNSGLGRIFGASPLMPIAAHYDPHPITNQMHDLATLFPMARTVEPAHNPNSSAVVSPLLETSAASYAITNLKGLASGRIRINPATAQHGPLTLGVAGTLPATAVKPQHQEARFVVYGSPDFAANAFLGFSGNRDLFLNTMNWLAGESRFITIRPKPRHNTPINLSATQMAWIRWSVLGMLPGVILLAGIFVWWRRRRK